MIILVAQFEFAAASRGLILEIARDMDSKTAKEENCVFYKHAIDVEDNSRLILTEIWCSTAALRAHFFTPHFRAFRIATRVLGLKSKLIQFNATEVTNSDPSYWKTMLGESELRSQ